MDKLFISYRQDGNGSLANQLYKTLSKNFDVFLDKENIKDGDWKQKIESELKKATHFVLVLTKGALNRCSNADDVLSFEIRTAYKLGLHIVPLTIDAKSYEWPQDLSKELYFLFKIQQSSILTNMGVEYEEMGFRKLVERLINHKSDKMTFYNELLLDTELEVVEKLEKLMPKIDAGDEYAEFIFSWLFCDEYGVDFNAKLESWLKTKEAQGKPFAVLALNYYENQDKLKKLFKELSAKGNVYHQIIYAKVFDNDIEDNGFCLLIKATKKEQTFSYIELIKNYIYYKEEYDKVDEYFDKIKDFRTYAAYLLAYFADGSKETQLKYYKLAADEGYSLAQYEYANLLEDTAESFKWYMKAACQNCADAQNMVSRCYEEGWGVEKDLEKAKMWLNKAEINGSKTALYNQAMNSYNEGDLEKAEEYWRKGVESYDRDALYELVTCILKPQERYKEAFTLLENWYKDSNHLFYKFHELTNQLAIFYHEGKGTPVNKKKARELFEIAYEKGELPIAAYYLAMTYKDENPREYRKWLICAADDEEDLAQKELATIYEAEGKYAEAIELYKKAIAQDNTDAMVSLGLCYKQGKIIPKNEGLATEYFLKAAELDNIKAMYFLYTMLEDNNYDEAQKWLKMSADKGFCASQYSLGIDYYLADKIEDSVKYISLAAAQGDEYAQYKLGTFYEYGEGVEEDKNEAIRLYELAADQGLADAQYSLACLIEEENPTRAFSLQKKAADSGYIEAVFELGWYYIAGIGTKQNTKEGKSLVLKAAYSKLVSAQDLYGEIMLEEGNYNEAIHWLTKAAENGSTDAKKKLGKLYFDGFEGFQSNYRLAKEWFLQSEKDGDEDSLEYLAIIYFKEEDYDNHYQIAQKMVDKDMGSGFYYLGNIYINGYGVSKNFKKAAEYFKEGANRGEMFSQQMLATSYELGLGVEKDLESAIMWYRFAAEQGDEFSKEKLLALTE